MPEITANGVRLHVQRLSPRHRPLTPTQPVVFIHGLGMDNMSSYYYTLANPVAQAGAEVILYDLRGHGLSERPRRGYRVADSVADLAALLDALGIEGPVHLVGNSYGGTVALSFAVSYPGRVASLVLIEAHFTVAGWAEQVAAERDRIGQSSPVVSCGRGLTSWAAKSPGCWPWPTTWSTRRPLSLTSPPPSPSLKASCKPSPARYAPSMANIPTSSTTPANSIPTYPTAC
jgi:pimeloyl-ACP methyl ester carboxylesterase